MSNLVLITSVIDTPNKQLSYSKIRSVFQEKKDMNKQKKQSKVLKKKYQIVK